MEEGVTDEKGGPGKGGSGGLDTPMYIQISGS